jgi:hypothetical protein
MRGVGKEKEPGKFLEGYNVFMRVTIFLAVTNGVPDKWKFP